MLNRRQFIATTAALASCSSGLEWNGFRYFTRGDPRATPLVVAPAGRKGLGELLSEDTINRFVSAGFYVVGVHWSGLDGGDEDYGARHRNISAWLSFMGLIKPLLYAQSRGGLQLLNFACDHPDRFSKIAALYPVTDPFVYPGKNEKLWDAYDTSESAFPVRDYSPNARAQNLRGKTVRIWHGDRDETVPKHLTTDVFAANSGAEVVTLSGLGHARIWLDDIPAWLTA